MKDFFKHETAIIDNNVKIGKKTKKYGIGHIFQMVQE